MRGRVVGLAVFVVLVMAVACAAGFFFRRECASVIAALTERHRTSAVPAKPAATVRWEADFSPAASQRAGAPPEGWRLEKKPGTRPATFSVEKGDAGAAAFLRMEADRASATLITRATGLDLREAPLLRWRWKATVLPEGADGRIRNKDDQAIGLYIGTGSALNNKSICYRWDTDTPKGAEGEAAYGFGGIKVKWYTLRNKQDAATGEWYVEERNVAEDFKEAWGFYPDAVYISVSCNSQYTGTRAAAELSRIQFLSPAAD